MTGCSYFGAALGVTAFFRSSVQKLDPNDDAIMSTLDIYEVEPCRCGRCDEQDARFVAAAGHVTLNDTAYNADRNITTGNPYKGLIADLMKRGVQVELCGATAKAHGWVNRDLLPGIKVNTDAMARTTQLVQEGFVKITE